MLARGALHWTKHFPYTYNEKIHVCSSIILQKYMSIDSLRSINFWQFFLQPTKPKKIYLNLRSQWSLTIQLHIFRTITKFYILRHNHNAYSSDKILCRRINQDGALKHSLRTLNEQILPSIHPLIAVAK